MDLREIGLGGCGLDSTGSGQGPVAGCCDCGDEPSGSCATELLMGYSHSIPAPPRSDRLKPARCVLNCVRTALFTPKVLFSSGLIFFLPLNSVKTVSFHVFLCCFVFARFADVSNFLSKMRLL
jgi:hypothetical protein